LGIDGAHLTQAKKKISDLQEIFNREPIFLNEKSLETWKKLGPLDINKEIENGNLKKNEHWEI
jgi:hypothetical protein